MKSMFLAAAILAAGAVAAEAQPMPVAPKVVPANGAASGLIEKVDWACGRGWRLNRWGECVPRRPPPPPRYHRPPPPPPGWGWGPPPRHHHHHGGGDRRWAGPPRW